VGSFAPITRHLSHLQGDAWTASFTALETILGEPLPRRARERKGWWSNAWPRAHPHERAWLDAGWRVTGVDLDAERITFHRSRKGEPPHAAAPPAMRRAVKAIERGERARTIGWFALGSGSAAVAAGLASGVAAFFIGRYFGKRAR
jgi:hypothetical protein